jgi:hypothetical protein
VTCQRGVSATFCWLSGATLPHSGLIMAQD